VSTTTTGSFLGKLNTLFIFILFLVYAILPTIVCKTLYDKTQTGKSIFFLCLLIAIFTICATCLLFVKKYTINIRLLDLNVIFLIAYVLTNLALRQNHLDVFAFWISASPFFLYFALRQIGKFNF